MPGSHFEFHTRNNKNSSLTRMIYIAPRVFKSKHPNGHGISLEEPIFMCVFLF